MREFTWEGKILGLGSRIGGEYVGVGGVFLILFFRDILFV